MLIQTISDSLVHAPTLLADINLDKLNPNLIIIMGVGLILGLTAIIFGTMSSISREKHRQRTKQEIAAYVAEGSMTPEDASNIIEVREKPSILD